MAGGEQLVGEEYAEVLEEDLLDLVEAAGGLVRFGVLRVNYLELLL